MYPLTTPYACLCALAALVSLTAALTPADVDLFYNITLPMEGNEYHLSTGGTPDHATTLTPRPQNYTFRIMASPSKADMATCLPLGPIGFAVNGVPFFHPYTVNGQSAVLGQHALAPDDCGGYTTPDDAYHYRGMPSCLRDSLFGTNHTGEMLFGVARDGFKIYGEYAGDTAGLDACHGKTHDGEYRYYLTTDFPYVLGCFMGTVLEIDPGNNDGDDDNDGDMHASNSTMAPEADTDMPMMMRCVFANVTSPNGWDDLTMGIPPTHEPVAGSAAQTTAVLALLLLSTVLLF